MTVKQYTAAMAGHKLRPVHQLNATQVTLLRFKDLSKVAAV
jgi:hypothetical protein